MLPTTLTPDDSAVTKNGDESIALISQQETIPGKVTPNQSYEEIEQTTGLIKMTSSPSLSALAGILNEKTQRADNMVKRLSRTVMKDVLEGKCQQNDAVFSENHSGSHSNSIKSPNLIDINDDGNALIFNNSVAVDQQPDFLNTPELEQNTMVGFHSQGNLHSYGKQGYSLASSASDTHARASNLSVAVTEEPSLSSLVGVGNIERQDSVAGSMSKNSGGQDELMKEEKPASTVAVTGNDPLLPDVKISKSTKTSKRRSMLGFWRKTKTSTEKKTMLSSVSTQSLSNTLANDSSKNNVEPDSPKPLRKKSLSTSNLFSNLRKPKKKQVQSHINENQIKTSLPKNKRNINDINKRKLTPLDFEMALPKKDPEPPKLNGDLFPKSLDASEIDSIVSFERSRSIKSAQRNSVSSVRRSLSDHISFSARNEGMFVTEGTSFVLSTPDLNKSPTNSILKNGRFDSDIEYKASPKKLLESNFLEVQNESGLPSQQTHFSFESIEEKLNELTIVSEIEEENVENSSVFGGANISQTENGNNSEVDDNDLISDIMEFASIIDFGQDLDFNFELGPENSSYQTLNPSRLNTEGDSFNSDKNRKHMDVDGIITKEEEYLHLQSKVGKSVSSSASIIDHKASSFSDSEPFGEEEFENEDFNGIQSNTNSPKINAFLPEPNHPLNRPISMSFRGLKAPQFNSQMELSRLSTFALSRQSVDERDSLGELIKSVRFSSQIILYETFGEVEYDRHPDIATCNQLTPQLAQLIKEELNELKSTMDIHEDSKCYTHFV